MQKAQRKLLVSGTRTNLANVGIWFRRLKTRRRLQELDARELADVGITERERRRECAKWFWQV
jgi:uncharacterized protein YjiS (DUF1127 family)